MRATLLVWIGLLVSVTVVRADAYRVTVSRIDRNLYRDFESKVIIETRYCYEYAYMDDAVLRWEGKYGNNWITFSSDTKCEVVALR